MGQFDSGDSWVRRSLGACNNDLMRQIVEDNRRGGDIHGRASVIPQKAKAKEQSEEPPRSQNGWVDPPKIRPPEGVALVDKLVDQQDRRDAIARAHEMGLSYAEWQKLSEQDLKDRQAQKEKAAKDRKETPK
jgi:hypothetical protein